MSPTLFRRALLCGVAVSLALTLGFGGTFDSDTAQAKTGKAVLGTWGVELTAMDKAVQPGDDFFRYAGGTWMKTTQIPADRARWGSFNILGAKSEEVGTYLGARGIKFAVFPGSPLRKKGPPWLMAAELVETTRLYARTVAAIDAQWLERVGAHLIKKTWHDQIGRAHV